MLFSIFELCKTREGNQAYSERRRLLVLVLFILIFTFLDNRVDRKTEVSELNESKNLF
jgi:preprotein translocase subunit YajC